MAENTSPSADAPSQVNLLYNQQSPLVYQPSTDTYVSTKSSNTVLPRLRLAFCPENVTPNYFSFLQWRMLQRWINANLHVLGTQSLLMGLGLQHKAAIGAAVQWVLKDALGKVVRLLWASKMGRRFDADAKRWRLRSAAVFATGNALEIVTSLCPSYFLVLATLANCCKQVSMLTSSSTRTAIYNSFGPKENIGDITAKGEAQIAVVDLIGITTGVWWTQRLPSRKFVALAYVVLQSFEIFCVYRTMRAVQYRVLNFERLQRLTYDFCKGEALGTPSALAANERILLPPPLVGRQRIAFGSLGRAPLNPDEFQKLQSIFRRERFLLVVGPNVKEPRSGPPDCDCHIVLHAQATNTDLVKATLALTYLRQRLTVNGLRSSDCYEWLEASLEEATRALPKFLKELQVRGWESPARSLFGGVHMRADWPLE